MTPHKQSAHFSSFDRISMKDRTSFIRGSLINRKLTRYLVIIVVIIIVGLLVRNFFASVDNSSNKSENRPTLKGFIASKELQRDFPINLKDKEGEKIEGVKMRVENVELRDEIIVQGQKATSVSGRSFLVVNIKLVNELKQAVEVNTKDYLRLGVSEQEWLAPDIHNDPVLIQAISTKPTRVAFPVDSNLRRFTLQVGEITGDKEKVEIDFTQ